MQDQIIIIALDALNHNQYLRRDGSIGALSNDPGLDLIRIASMDRFLNCTGNQDVAFLVHQTLALVLLGARGANDRAVLLYKSRSNTN